MNALIIFVKNIGSVSRFISFFACICPVVLASLLEKMHMMLTRTTTGENKLNSQVDKMVPFGGTS